jgi:hypothetical protein
MTAGSPGLMGVLLIVIGLAFALLAIAVVLNRRDAQAEAEAERPEAAADESEEPPGEPDQEGGEGQPELAEESGAGSHEPGSGDQETARGEAAQQVPVQPEPAAVEPPAPSPRALLPVAELLREEVTGRLILRLGDQLIRSPGDLDSEADRRRLQYASADLAEWFKDLEGPPPRAAAGPPRRGQRAAAPSPPAAAADQADEVAAESAGPQPRSMIEAINAILDRRLAGTEGAPRAVRLVPDPSGGVRVLIGVKSYPLEEVPDQSIRELIRQAVAEWEESQ